MTCTEFILDNTTTESEKNHTKIDGVLSKLIGPPTFIAILGCMWPHVPVYGLLVGHILGERKVQKDRDKASVTDQIHVLPNLLRSPVQTEGSCPHAGRSLLLVPWTSGWVPLGQCLIHTHGRDSCNCHRRTQRRPFNTAGLVCEGEPSSKLNAS